MSTPHPLIAAWARSAVVPRNGAFKTLHAHDIATPVLHTLLERAGIDANAVDAVVMGNALGAGGNPARMLALHAGLNQRCAAYTVDTQCCAGLDAVAIGAALIASGQAHVVVAGGAEAWSRSPIRMHRPLTADTPAEAYERPAFAPNPAQDPDMLLSAARYATQAGYTRAQQEAYALQSHMRATMHQAEIAKEIVPIMGIAHDVYPRHIDAARAARMPVVARSDAENSDDTCALSALAISAQADGAAFVLLVSPQACEQYKLTPQAEWIAHASVGSSRGDRDDAAVAVQQRAAAVACRWAGGVADGGSAASRSCRGSGALLLPVMFASHLIARPIPRQASVWRTRCGACAFPAPAPNKHIGVDGPTRTGRHPGWAAPCSTGTAAPVVVLRRTTHQG